MSPLNVKISPYTGAQVFNNPKVLDPLLALDRENMTPIMQKSGYEEFPWEKRINGLNRETTHVFCAYSEEKLIGYIEIGRDRAHSHFLYVYSIQIQEEYRCTSIFVMLVQSAFKDLDKKSFSKVLSDVQVSNKRMIKIFERLGFTLQETGTPTWKASASLENLLSSPLFCKVAGWD